MFRKYYSFKNYFKFSNLKFKCFTIYIAIIDCNMLVLFSNFVKISSMRISFVYSSSRCTDYRIILLENYVILYLLSHMLTNISLTNQKLCDMLIYLVSDVKVTLIT